jgi:L-lysine exporter family protein LysE/ArgO
MSSFIHGMLLSASLIVAIGAQNAFVLRQGLERRHVFPIVMLCATSDALLSVLGIFGMGGLFATSPLFLSAMAWAGALYLVWFGARSLRRALRPTGPLAPSASRAQSWQAAMGTTLALTYLNPHVYLDTVMILGNAGAHEPAGGQLAFWFGTTTASLLWFFSLGYGARLLRRWFLRPTAWRVLDCAIGVTMWSLAAALASRGLN